MISFVHRMPGLASYRYRCSIPAGELGMPINDFSADGFVIAKPTKDDLELGPFIVDFCDDHFDDPLYHEFAKRAWKITCPTKEMARLIKEKTGRDAVVIFDPYEFPEKEPHCNGKKLFWFGHASNFHTLERVLPDLLEYDIRVISNVPGMMEYNRENMEKMFAWADIVIIPATKDYKSPNRAIEAIRQGCWVVAEPHPSLEDFPIWKGNIKEGIECSQPEVKKAQQFVRKFSPKIQADAWSQLLKEFASTLAVEKSTGRVGSTSISLAVT